MNNDAMEQLIKQFADDKEKELEKIELFPLSQYSTTELKAELRRRKKR